MEEPVLLEIYDAQNRLVDCYSLSIKMDNQIKEEKGSVENILFKEDKNHVTIVCENNTSIVFDKKTGLINKIQNLSDTLAVTGPYLNLRTKGTSLIYSYHHINEYSKNWTLKDFSFKWENNKVTVSIKGKSKEISAIVFDIVISSDGKIECSYFVKDIPKEYIRETGIRFELENVIDSLSWKRDSYWSYYPPGHLSAQEGNVSLYSGIQSTYRNAPNKDWVFDCKSFYYEGTDNESISDQLTHIAKATKEHIREYTLYNDGQKVLSVLGDGDISCRIAKQENTIQLFTNNKMDYVDLSWGNFQRNILLEKDYSDKVVFKMNTHSGDKHKNKTID